jgi:hypothetical protein
LVFIATLHHRRLCHNSPTLPSPVFVAMATIARELHDDLVTVLNKLNTVVAVLQRINAEQQNCIHKLDVMAGIQLLAQPSPTPLPVLASPTSCSRRWRRWTRCRRSTRICSGSVTNNSPCRWMGCWRSTPICSRSSMHSRPRRRQRHNLQFNRRCCFRRHCRSHHRRALPPPAELNPDRRSRLPL